MAKSRKKTFDIIVPESEEASTSRPSTRQLARRDKVLRDEIQSLKFKLNAMQAYAYRLERSPAVTSSLAGEVIQTLVDALKFGPAEAVRQYRAYRIIKASNLFDSYFYSRQSNLAGRSPASLLHHYIVTGFKLGLDPCPGFSTSKYLDFYADVKANGIEPLSHFLSLGRRENRIAILSSHAPIALEDGYLAGAADMESRQSYPWPMAQSPDKDMAELAPFDSRPDDAVPVEGAAGAAFMERFDLLTATPDWAGATEALNDMTPSPAVIGGSERPVEVSIIVPVYGQLAYTLNSLHALIQHKSRYNFEIIVGDDRSPDDSGLWLPKLRHINYQLRGTNEGFIVNCNLAAMAARGAYLVMLNNDTRVVEGWLDALIDSFDRFPKAGMVGSKLFYPDGLLQEAGGIVWQDGSAWNYGRGDDPNRPRYCYARQVDYVSGCSIAIPTPVWKEMGGFDPYFSPAYCEDVDLCFRLRQAGYETWFQPQSRIIHYEGKTSGTDTGEGIKAYQVANTAKLFDRWESTLTLHRPNSESPWLERDRSVSKRVLVIDAVNPTPWQDAGSLAVVNLFRYYQANGYQVSFVPENLLYERRAVSEIQAAGVQVFYAPYESGMPALLQIYGGLFDTIHVIRAEVAHKTLDLIRRLTPHVMAIYQNCDLHYLRMERQAIVEKKPELLMEAAAMKARELQLSRDYDLTITHSEAEKQILDSELPDENILVMPLIEQVVESHAPFSGRCDFMFLGGYGHPPNVDAALWILEEIWPAIEKACPDARLLLVGANPPEAIARQAGERVVVTGMVADLAPWFAQTRVFLAALRYGAGAKGKVLASLAHGVPVVATDIAAEGLPLSDGESVFMANTAKEIVNEALRLYGLNEREWNIYSTNAKAYIDQHHSFATGVELLGKVLASND